MTELVGILSSKGLCIVIKDIIEKYGKDGLRKIKGKYTISYYNHITKLTYALNGWVISSDKKKLVLPRTAATKLLDTNILDRVIYNINIDNDMVFDYQGKPTSNQKVICDYLMKNIYQDGGDKCCILKALAGSGKTFIGFEMIHLIKKKTVIIVPNTYLLNQWLKLLKELFPNNTIGEYYTKKKVDGDIVIMIINSASDSNTFKFKKGRNLYEEINADLYFKTVGLVIYDECHMYSSKKFKRIFNRANVENVFGLSATPDEKSNGFDKLIKFHLGKIIDAENIEKYEKSFNNFSSSVQICRYNAHDDFSNIYTDNKTKLVCVYKILEELISDPYRNKLIINKLIDFYKEKRNIFVFSDRREHVELLYYDFMKEIKAQNIDTQDNIFIPEVNKNDEQLLSSSILYGGSGESDIDMAVKQSKVIFTTYQYSSTGVSIVKMDTLILATPRRSNMKQIIGRIFRLGSNMNKKRIIVDILDNKSVLKGQYSDRKKAYIHRDSEFEEEKIEYSDIIL